MEEEPELINSPLERQVRQGGLSVNIHIYRTENEGTWILEVEDHLGGSTVWNDRFPTDQAALDEALKAIEEDGIASFTVKADSYASHQKPYAAPTTPDLASPLSKSEESELARLLEASEHSMDFPEARGFFAALASVPALVPPSHWLPVVLGDRRLTDEREAAKLLGLLTRAYNDVVDLLSRGDRTVCPPGDDWEETEGWCYGYHAGLSLAKEDGTDLKGDPTAQRALDVIGILCHELEIGELRETIEDEEAWLDAESRKLPEYALHLHAEWKRIGLVKAHPPQHKVGRNDPCPCGSGRKFKKCCAN